MKRGKDSIDLDYKSLFKSSMLLKIEKKKVVRDLNLNFLVDCGFDLSYCEWHKRIDVKKSKKFFLGEDKE